MTSADRFAQLVAPVAAIVVGFAAVAGTQGAVEFRSDDYTHVEGWTKLPSNIGWGSVISVEPDPDGEHVWALRAEPPIVKFDPDGHLIKTFGDGIFVRPHGFHMRRVRPVVHPRSACGPAGSALYRISPSASCPTISKDRE